MIHWITADLIVDLWPGVEPFLAKALKRHPFLTTSSLLQLLLAGRAQMLLVTDKGIAGAAVMEAVQYPQCMVGNVLALGGRRGFMRHDLPALIIELERWCREKRCDTIMLLGRPGWSKVAVRQGGKSVPLLMAWKPLTRSSP